MGENICSCITDFILEEFNNPNYSEKETAGKLKEKIETCPSCMDSVKDLLSLLSSPEIVDAVSHSFYIPIDKLEEYSKDHLLLYLANPQGFHELGRMGLYLMLATRLEKLDKSIKIIEPFIMSKPLAPDIDDTQIIEEHKENMKDFNYKIIENNWKEMELADLTVAMGDGSGTDIDSGVASEIADLYDKCPIYLLRSDFRPGENLGSRGLNAEPWGKMMANKKNYNLGGIYHRLAHLEEAIKEEIPYLWNEKVKHKQ